MLYADDLYLLAPCIDGLPEMLKICEKYANDHNLKFSTDSNPNKSKTKCMAYLLKERELPRPGSNKRKIGLDCEHDKLSPMFS